MDEGWILPWIQIRLSLLEKIGEISCISTEFPYKILQFCNCPVDAVRSLVTPQNFPQKWCTINHSVKKTNCECEPLRTVSLKQLLGMVDLVWEAAHYISEHFSDVAVRIAYMSRNCTCATSPISDVCDYSAAIVLRLQQVTAWKVYRFFQVELLIPHLFESFNRVTGYS